MQPIDMDRLGDRVTKAHVKLMAHDETSLYGGVMLMGNNTFSDMIPTAATDGINKFYNPDFCSKQRDSQLRFIVLHEALHIFLRHLTRHPEFFKEDPATANEAADYVDNAIIMSLKDKTLCEVPEGVAILYKPKYIGWSFSEVYYDLRKEKAEKKQPSNGSGAPDASGTDGQAGKPEQQGTTLDHHDLSKVESMGDEERKDMERRIESAAQQGGILAGRRGQAVPRSVQMSLIPKVLWTDVMRDFVSTQAQGKDDDVSLRRLDKRWLLEDIIIPTTISETVGEAVFGFDISGSIPLAQVADGLCEIRALAQSVQPEKVRILWWDTSVRSEQVFTPDQYDSIDKLLKPMSGGGTTASCVSAYIAKQGYKPDCVVMFTDGYVESQVRWEGMPPTLWVVTKNIKFNPPAGRVVDYNNG